MMDETDKTFNPAVFRDLQHTPCTRAGLDPLDSTAAVNNEIFKMPGNSVVTESTVGLG